MRSLVFTIVIAIGALACATPRPPAPSAPAINQDSGASDRMATSLRELDARLAQMRSDFEKLPADPRDPEWVVKKLAYMAGRIEAIDDWYGHGMRAVWNSGELEYGNQAREERVRRIEKENTAELAKLLDKYGWFSIGRFGEKADADAMRLLESTRDRDLQKEVLARLTDRVLLAETGAQRYDMIGSCMGLRWEGKKLADPEGADERRKAIGLPPLAETIRGFDYCERIPRPLAV